MGSDSITNASTPVFSKDFGKKKRTNRSAKLKQCKLDARREQWLSQVKNKGYKEELNGRAGYPPSSFHVTSERNVSLENLKIRSREEENEGSSFHDSDLESLASSPVCSVLGDNHSSKDCPGSSNESSSSSSSHSSSGCCSGSISEDEAGDDGCLDDWEAVADALSADEKQHHSSSEVKTEPEILVGPASFPELPNEVRGVNVLKQECKASINGRAWRPDDSFRPQTLPNLSKQHSFPSNSELHCGRGAVTWACPNIISQPSSCPICYEDLDVTDSSFLPCSCGFRLCLFCHKRILESDGRCPGCRKLYALINGESGLNGGAPCRSYSMNIRS